MAAIGRHRWEPETESLKVESAGVAAGHRKDLQLQVSEMFSGSCLRGMGKAFAMDIRQDLQL